MKVQVEGILWVFNVFNSKLSSLKTAVFRLQQTFCMHLWDVKK